MRILLLFSTLLLLSCSSQRIPDLGELLHHHWEASKVAGTTKLPFFTIAPNLQATGSDGCNRFKGQVQVDRRIAFNQLASTKMACAHGIDQAFWKAVDQHDRWRIKKGKLQLLKGRKVLMTFVSKPQPAKAAEMVGEMEESE